MPFDNPFDFAQGDNTQDDMPLDRLKMGLRNDGTMFTNNQYTNNY